MSSSSDDDEGFDEDMEALRRACFLSGTDPNSLSLSSSAASPPESDSDDDLELVRGIRKRFDDQPPLTLKTLSVTDPHSLPRCSAAAASAPAESDSDDDLELVRGIRKRFDNEETPLTLKPLSVLLPSKGGDGDDDEDDDDFAVLRSIQKRFSRYDNDMLGNNNEKQGKVRSNSTYSEKGTSNNTRPAKTNASTTYAPKINVPKPKAVPNSVDMRYTNNSEKVDTPPITEAFSPCFTEGRDMDTQDSSITEAFSPCFTEGHDIDTHDSPITEAFSPCFTEGRDIDTHDSTMVSTEGSDFPKAAQMFVDAIRKNRACQKFIRNKMMNIEARIEENKKLQHRVKTLRGFQIKCKKETSRALSQKQDARYQLISTVKLKGKSKADIKDSVICHGPVENSHVGCYRMVFAEYHTSLSRRKWTDEERENLVKGIKQQFQELLLQKSVDSISEMEGGPNDIDDIYASIREHDITPESMRSFLPKVNWERLASMYVTGRSGAECESRWLNCEDPLINHKPWTSSEDKELLLILQERGISNWIEIAVLLGTNRPPFQCLARYQRSLNASILKSEWTKDEDEKLCDAVATFGESNWENVAATLVGRTGPQCSNRWIKSLNPAREITGRWSLDVDKQLKIAVVFFGKNWKKVANFVPGRTHVQCRERWANCLDPNLKMGDWTEEEDNKLKEAIAEIGFCWSKVAASVASRTDNQCTRRWKVLFPNEVRQLQDARKMRKAALISNFVDREAERPALGPNDFIPLILPNGDSESAELNQSGKKQKNKPRSKKATKNAVTSGKNNPKKKRTRCCKNKAAPEVAETLRVGQEIVQFDGIIKMKPIRIRKVESRSKNVAKKAKKDESLSTKGGKKSISKKNMRASKKKKEASEATENARNCHATAVPFDGETNTRKTSRKRKMTSRYENAIKEALICTDEIPLTYHVDVEEVAGHKTNVNKKPTRQCKKDKENSEATDARVGLVVFDGQTKKRKHNMPLRDGLKEKNIVPTAKSFLKKIDVPTNSNLSACGDSEVITTTTLEEVVEHNGERTGQKNITISKLGRKKKERPKRFDEAASSFGVDEAFTEAKGRYADPTEVNSLPCLNIVPLRRINVDEAEKVADFDKRKKGSVISRSNRIKCRALLREAADVTEISDSETLGSIMLKKRKARRSLKMYSGLNHSLKSGSIINKEVDAMDGGGLVSEIRTTKNNKKPVSDHPYSRGEREGHKPQAWKSENAELGEKRKRLKNSDKQSSNVVQFGKEGDDMSLASLFKKKHKKRKVNFAPKTPTFDELPNRLSSIGHVDEAADSDTCSPPPGFGEPVYKASHLELA